MILEELLAYDSWANKRLYVQLFSQNAWHKIPQTEALFVHIIAAQTIWCNRMQDIDETPEVWPATSLGASENDLIENRDRLKELLSKVGQTFTYTDTLGEEHENRVEDILHHIVIHGQHHRAQIALLMRQHDLSPPPTDYVVYLRNKNL